jgi:hypothetical protein
MGEAWEKGKSVRRASWGVGVYGGVRVERMGLGMGSVVAVWGVGSVGSVAGSAGKRAEMVE